MLNVSAPAAAFTDRRARFDLDADGALDSIPTLGPGSGLLALDENGDGRVNDGRELFGPTTGDGFAELAAHDADTNGWIDEADPVFGRLRLWQPASDGAGRLQTLAEAGVGAIALARVATPFTYEDADTGDTQGVARATGVYLTDEGEARSVQQVDFAV